MAKTKSNVNNACWCCAVHSSGNSKLFLWLDAADILAEARLLSQTKHPLDLHVDVFHKLGPLVIRKVQSQQSKHLVVMVGRSCFFLIKYEEYRLWTPSSPGGKAKTYHMPILTLTRGSIKGMPVFILVLRLFLSPSCFALSVSRVLFLLKGRVFPELLYFFHCYLGIVTKEKNASSCFGYTTDDVFLSCLNRAPFFPCKKHPAQWQHE